MCYNTLESYLVFRDGKRCKEFEVSPGVLLSLRDALPQEEIDSILEDYPTAVYVYYDYFEEIDQTVIFLLDENQNKLLVDVIDEDDSVVSEYSGTPELHTDLLEIWKKHVKIP